MRFAKTLLFLGFLLPPLTTSGQAAEPETIEGRWLLTADLPDGRFSLPVEIIHQAKGRISVAALGGGVKFSGATLKGNQLVLRGTFSFLGPLVVRARIDGATLQGDWRAGSSAGHLVGERQGVNSSPQLRLKVFEEVCQRIEQDYYDPAFGGIDWRAVEQKHRPQAQNTQSDSELFETINGMLGELKSSHLKFAASPFPESADNSISSDTDDKFNLSKVITWRRLSAQAGYLKVTSFLDGPEFLQLIDRAFHDLGELPALLIDLRDNGGGTLSAAMRLGDHLLAQPQRVGFFATRSGLERRSVRSMDDLDPAKLPQYAGYDVDAFFSILREAGAVALVTGGRVTPVYRGKLVLLVNRVTASAAEAFAALMKELGLAVLVGPRPTAGKMLSSRELKLSGGWNLTLPEADFRTWKGLRLEGHGVTPDIVVKRASGDHDIPLLEAAKLVEHPQ